MRERVSLLKSDLVFMLVRSDYILLFLETLTSTQCMSSSDEDPLAKDKDAFDRRDCFS